MLEFEESSSEGLPPKTIKEIDKKSDIYAFGITLFELMTRSFAWPAISAAQVKKNVIELGLRPDIPTKVMDSFINAGIPSLLKIYDKCVLKAPDDRPSALQIVEYIEYDLENLIPGEN